MHSKRSVPRPALALLALLPWLGGCAALAGKTSDSKNSDAKGTPKKEAKSETSAEPTPMEAAPWNDAIIAAVEKLPLGGGYATTLSARDALQSAVAWEDGRPALRPARAQPSFCSGATYLVFMIALAQQQRAGLVQLT
ncbi:MAG: hypothetical protein EBS01_00200, partial [Verrucomicrobia bacterium]|nr:hypothetical protein [Verrucomicrobiota bacterium]